MSQPIEKIRDAVATALEQRGIGDRPFYEEIREGRRDNGPFMIGALAWAESTDQRRPSHSQA